MSSTPTRALLYSAVVKAGQFFKRKCHESSGRIRAVNWNQMPGGIWNWIKTHKYELVFGVLCPKPIYLVVCQLLTMAGIDTEKLFNNSEVCIKQHLWQAALLFASTAAVCVVLIVYSPGIVAGGLAASAAAAGSMLGLALCIHLTSAGRFDQPHCHAL